MTGSFIALGLHDWKADPPTPDEKNKVSERIRRLNFGNLEIEITVNDPKAYSRPWTVQVKQVGVFDTELLDAYCLENEKDVQHLPPHK